MVILFFGLPCIITQKLTKKKMQVNQKYQPPTHLFDDLGVSKNRETPQNGWFTIQNPIKKWMIWGENPRFFGNNLQSWHYGSCSEATRWGHYRWCLWLLADGMGWELMSGRFWWPHLLKSYVGIMKDRILICFWVSDLAVLCPVYLLHMLILKLCPWMDINVEIGAVLFLQCWSAFVQNRPTLNWAVNRDAKRKKSNDKSSSYCSLYVKEEHSESFGHFSDTCLVLGKGRSLKYRKLVIQPETKL